MNKKPLNKLGLLLIPGLIFAGFVWLAIAGLTQDKNGQPLVSSAGKAVPEMKLPILNSRKLLTEKQFKGKKVLVNFFASWCVPCIAEHEFLKAVQVAIPLPIIGIAYKDKDAAIKKYLKEHGNPFQTVAFDREGRSAIDWGVTGVPETFLVGADGVIISHVSGPLSIPVWDKYFKPFLTEFLVPPEKNTENKKAKEDEAKKSGTGSD